MMTKTAVAIALTTMLRRTLRRRRCSISVRGFGFAMDGLGAFVTA